jgi:CRP/FNR family transcriptional regulator, anaerobic regulatory protein
MQADSAVRSIHCRPVNSGPSRLNAIPTDTNFCGACFHKPNCLARNLDAEEFCSYSRAISQSKRLAKGHCLYRLSEPFDALFMILSGSVKSCRLDEDGNEQIVGHHIPGDLLALDAIGGEVHRSSGIALEDCFICRIPYRLVAESSSESRHLQEELLNQTAQALRTEQLHSVFLRKNPADERLAMFLVELSRKLESRHYASDRINLSLSRRDIGNYLGLALETVSRSFSRLQEAGMIEVHHRHITIHDREQLDYLGRGLAAQDQKLRRAG